MLFTPFTRWVQWMSKRHLILCSTQRTRLTCWPTQKKWPWENLQSVRLNTCNFTWLETWWLRCLSSSYVCIFFFSLTELHCLKVMEREYFVLNLTTTSLSWAKLAADVFSPQEEHQDLKPTLIVDKPCIYIVTWCTGATKRCFPISLHVKEASLKQWIQPQ